MVVGDGQTEIKTAAFLIEVRLVCFMLFPALQTIRFL